MAAALRKMEIRDFSPENIRSRELLDLARKVVPIYDPGLKNNSKTMLPAVVEIMTLDGSVFSRRVDLVYGHPQNPMNWDDLIRKFKDCTSYSAKVIPEKNVDQIIEKVLHLEDVVDMVEIINPAA
jgi:2-methylcitrate dehydratase PrpD